LLPPLANASHRNPRYATITAQGSKSSGDASPAARGRARGQVHRRSSLPRFAIITTQVAESSGDAPRGQAGGVILFFAFISLCLTIIIENWKSIVRLICFNKEEWKKLLAGTRIWLFLFVVFCSIFYFAVIK
jgi:hypothetical protein